MIATGMKDFLWLSVKLLIATGLWLNVLLCSDSTLWSEWESFPRIERSLDSVLLSVTASSGSNSTPRAELAHHDQFVPSVGVRHLRLIEHPQHGAAGLEGRPPHRGWGAGWDSTVTCRGVLGKNCSHGIIH